MAWGIGNKQQKQEDAEIKKLQADIVGRLDEQETEYVKIAAQRSNDHQSPAPSFYHLQNTMKASRELPLPDAATHNQRKAALLTVARMHALMSLALGKLTRGSPELMYDDYLRRAHQLCSANDTVTALRHSQDLQVLREIVTDTFEKHQNQKASARMIEGMSAVSREWAKTQPKPGKGNNGKIERQ